MTMLQSFRCACLGALLLAGPGLGAAPTWSNLMNYQGQLTDSSGNAVTDGTYAIVFDLYTGPSGGTAIWTESQPAVSVTKGLFNVVLGSVTALPAAGPPNYYYSSGDLWLGVKVGADAEMTPRQQLLPAAYARNAQAVAGLLPNNSASNLVVLDASGKIPAGLVQAGSISAPFDLTGSAGYGLNVANAGAGGIGLTVTAATAVVAQASTGMALSATTASTSSPAIFASGAYPLRLLVGNGVSGNLGLQAGTPNDDMDANLVDRSHQAALWASTSASGAVGVSATAALGSGVLGVSAANDPAQAGVQGLSTGSGSGVQGWGVTGVAGTASAASGIGVGGVNTNASAGSGAYGVLGQVASSNAVGVAGTNSGASGTGLVGRHLGTGAGMGVRGISPSGVGAFGVFGTVSGSASIGVNGFSGGSTGLGVLGAASASDAFGVEGIQSYIGNPQNLAPTVAGVYGRTLNLGVGTGVRGEGNQGVVGNSNGYCGLCGFNQAGGLNNYGAYINSASQGLWVDATGTAGASFAVTGNIASTVAGSAAATFQASGSSGQTYGVNAINTSPNGYAVYANGGHDGVHAAALAGGANIYSDPQNNPAYGFYHNDGNPQAGGLIGVFSNENCSDCFAGIFKNQNATSGSGAALNVQGRILVQNSAGIFVAPNTATSYTLNNAYLTPTSLLFLTVASATGSVAAVTAKAVGSATITFTPALTADTTYQFLIIGQ